MKICKKCGKELQDSFNLCPYCGTPVSKAVQAAVAEEGIDLNDIEKWSAQKIDEENSKASHPDSYYTKKILDNIVLDKNLKEIIEPALTKLLTFTTVVAGKIVQVGKIILQWIIDKILPIVPYVIFGAVVGFIIGVFLCGLVPFVGKFLTPFIAPLCAKIGGVIGLVVGCKKQIFDSNPEIGRKIKEMLAAFAGTSVAAVNNIVGA